MEAWASNPIQKGHGDYCSLAWNIPEYNYSIDAMPIKLDPKRLDDGNGIEKTEMQSTMKVADCNSITPNGKKLRRDHPTEAWQQRRLFLVKYHTESAKAVINKNVSCVKVKSKGVVLDKQ